jgi:large subunit ribosomal protein L5
MLARYRQDIRPTLVREFGYTSPMQAPALEKIVLNMGLGEALTNGRALETAPQQLAVIAGQRPVITKARRSVASFKVREGQSIGCAVTLRGRRMWEFLDRFINLALPRIRDFRGLSRRSFDGKGNYSMGIREQIIFPEIDYNNLDRIRGLQVTIGTTAESDREGFRLLELLGMPFVREGQVR